MEILDLKKKAVQLRKRTWTLIYKHHNGHTGSDLSCTDILVALYYDVMNQNTNNFGKKDIDTYIQSKGHAVEIWYEILADLGYIDQKDLDKKYSTFNSPYIGHPTTEVHGMAFHTGSLGHGLGLGVGVSLAAKMNRSQKHIYVLMGDGEQAEGSIWEAAMAAGNYSLDNLTAIIDHNDLQISGTTDSVMRSNPISDKYRAFGWDVQEVDGNNMEALINILNKANNTNKPRLIIANTVKGKGITVAENRADWHHKIPSPEEYEQGIKQLDAQMEALENE
ncbi:transketolase [Lactobacillus mulieris]|uniref:Transketolase n=1 Tax=Lactobacillus mulieris TaxID=2508708 RepID=A0AAP3GWQ2_9LACO|nr:transketolase [Lactobacillus mulieris]MCF1784104.1 transketolase [Lactobacillus mulieris]MCZ3844261.1 transketolase [Lactobacillus mulieris]MCZ3875922.1 transketolase [Lactobacillus mulieris]MCZ3899358.1 transketolase [Lactobacillus mulieris]MCZ9649003.1 transketolase [Lactobacillus mulieris]